ncbi:MAG: cation:proton antiporter [Flavobacteriales bacterium]|nr:cation:proton antiporter [Flavobacteriales bacterium]MDG1780851.1 cation:proton antiporter [Flavobacteriales bacterium]
MLAAAIDLTSAYGLMIGASVVIILSYFAQVISRKTNIPSVLLLIGLGIGIKQGMLSMDIVALPYEGLLLEILGTVGLIFIVLEAALDLELSRSKWPIIWKSFTVALIALMGSSMAIAAFLNYMIIPDFLNALVYAIPLSIMSSAIIIPSVGGLAHDQKEFMVYESTFSDILGIMFFYLLLGNAGEANTGQVAVNVFSNIGLTLVIAVVVCYGLVWVIQKMTSEVKLFLTIAILLLIYAVQKVYHLSPLILILAFGLMINNPKLFWFKGIRRFVNLDRLKSLHNEFHLLTLESAFVIRTFFFVIFGITITLASLLSWEVLFFSLVITVLLYLVRFLLLLVFDRKNIFPLLYIAPRGLITILLFFQIYSAYDSFASDAFDRGILLQVIFITSLVMTISLIQNGFGLKEVVRNVATGDLTVLEEPEEHPNVQVPGKPTTDDQP